MKSWFVGGEVDSSKKWGDKCAVAYGALVFGWECWQLFA